MDKKCEKKEEDEKCHSGLGLAILAAAAAAGYFLYGSRNSTENRVKVKGWMLKAKGEVLEKIEKLKYVSEDEYNKIIDKVASKYSRMKDMDEGEVCAMMDDLRKHWKKIQRQIEPKAKKAKIKGKKIAKKATKVAKKAVNKAAKTVAKKTEAKPKPPIKKSSKK